MCLSLSHFLNFLKMSIVSNGAKTVETHIGGAKRLSALVDDYVLTMQHALRQDLQRQLEIRAEQEADVLPKFSVAEMYDYLVDTDPEFFNWCFPFCAVVLTRENLGYIHQRILHQFRQSLEPVKAYTVNDLREAVQIENN